MTPEHEAAMRERIAKASPGPWGLKKVEDWTEDSDRCVYSEEDGRWLANVGNWARQNLIIACCDEALRDTIDLEALNQWVTYALKNTYEADKDDADFIAHARTDLPLCLNEIGDLRRRLECYRNAYLIAELELDYFEDLYGEEVRIKSTEHSDRLWGKLQDAKKR